MHQQGRLKEETIRFLVGSISDNLKSKFGIDENGFWFNKRLEQESETRRAFVDSRRNNGKKGGRPKANGKPNAKPNGKPTHNLTEDEDEDENVFENQIGNAFDEFWRLYDFNTDMVMCQREWSNIDKQEYPKIIDYVPQYVERTPDKRYRKKPLTFLKGRNWNDELPPLKEDSNFIDYSKVDYTK